MMDYREFNKSLIKEYRENGGKLSGQMANSLLVLLTTTGRRSGEPHTVPLGFALDGGTDRIAVFASNIASPKHPAWYQNLVANPEVTVELRSEKFAARASTAEGAEGDRLYDLIVTKMPPLADHQAKTERRIPVVLLERRR